MPCFIAFLRGINLGKRRLPMSRLKALFEELKFKDVATFIASGNVLFTATERDTAKLEARIGAHLEKSLGYSVDTFVRTAEAVAAVAAAKVFPEDGRDGVTIHVAFLQRELPAEVATKLAGIRTADDEFRVIGREFYWLCRIRTSDSKVWTLPEMKALRLPTVTMRNLGSVRKLVAKHVA
ncbi:MAG: DUF1697 domain-containing protein [Opitutaceae bacterium]|nr:DUF1697 domain-containing protein [Opitutaceae bacterium]